MVYRRAFRNIGSDVDLAVTAACGDRGGAADDGVDDRGPPPPLGAEDDPAREAICGCSFGCIRSLSGGFSIEGVNQFSLAGGDWTMSHRKFSWHQSCGSGIFDRPPRSEPFDPESLTGRNCLGMLRVIPRWDYM